MHMLDAVLVNKSLCKSMKRSLAVVKIWFIKVLCSLIHVHTIWILCFRAGLYESCCGTRILLTLLFLPRISHAEWVGPRENNDAMLIISWCWLAPRARSSLQGTSGRLILSTRVGLPWLWQAYDCVLWCKWYSIRCSALSAGQGWHRKADCVRKQGT